MDGKIPAIVNIIAPLNPLSSLPIKNAKLIAVTPGTTFDFAKISLKSLSDINFFY